MVEPTRLVAVGEVVEEVDVGEVAWMVILPKWQGW